MGAWEGLPFCCTVSFASVLLHVALGSSLFGTCARLPCRRHLPGRGPLALPPSWHFIGSDVLLPQFSVSWAIDKMFSDLSHSLSIPVPQFANMFADSRLFQKDAALPQDSCPHMSASVVLEDVPTRHSGFHCPVKTLTVSFNFLLL